MRNSIQAYKTPSLYLVYLLFIKNRMILEYKVTLLVLLVLIVDGIWRLFLRQFHVVPVNLLVYS